MPPTSTSSASGSSFDGAEDGSASSFSAETAEGARRLCPLMPLRLLISYKHRPAGAASAPGARCCTPAPASTAISSSLLLYPLHASLETSRPLPPFHCAGLQQRGDAGTQAVAAEGCSSASKSEAASGDLPAASVPQAAAAAVGAGSSGGCCSDEPPPAAFICPITAELMSQPVVIPTGQT